MSRTRKGAKDSGFEYWSRPACSFCKDEGVIYEHSTVETCYCQVKPDPVNESIKRLEGYIQERRKMRAVDHEVHAGTEREQSVRIDDVETIIAALKKAR